MKHGVVDEGGWLFKDFRIHYEFSWNIPNMDGESSLN